MNIREQIRNDLKDSRISTLCSNVFMLHKPKNTIVDTYIEWQLINDVESDFSGNKNLSEEYILQVDVFSKSDFVDVIDMIRLVFKEKKYGFIGSFDTYETETELFSNKIRFKKKGWM